MKPIIICELKLYIKVFLIYKYNCLTIQYLYDNPDHHTKSPNVAGWRLLKYILAMRINASSQFIEETGFTLLAVNAYVVLIGNRFPLQMYLSILPYEYDNLNVGNQIKNLI